MAGTWLRTITYQPICGNKMIFLTTWHAAFPSPIYQLIKKIIIKNPSNMKLCSLPLKNSHILSWVFNIGPAYELRRAAMG